MPDAPPANAGRTGRQRSVSQVEDEDDHVLGPLLVPGGAAAVGGDQEDILDSMNNQLFHSMRHMEAITFGNRVSPAEERRNQLQSSIDCLLRQIKEMQTLNMPTTILSARVSALQAQLFDHQDQMFGMGNSNN